MGYDKLRGTCLSSDAQRMGWTAKGYRDSNNKNEYVEL